MKSRGWYFRLRNWLSALLTRGYGHCLRCGGRWNVVKAYVIRILPFQVLCESCWTELGTADARLEYYELQFDAWIASGANPSPTHWRQIEAAVRAGR